MTRQQLYASSLNTAIEELQMVKDSILSFTDEKINDPWFVETYSGFTAAVSSLDHCVEKI